MIVGAIALVAYGGAGQGRSPPRVLTVIGDGQAEPSSAAETLRLGVVLTNGYMGAYDADVYDPEPEREMKMIDQAPPGTKAYVFNNNHQIEAYDIHYHSESAAWTATLNSTSPKVQGGPPDSWTIGPFSIF